MSIANKLTYLNDTKTLLRTNINAIGGDLTEEDTFRSYANMLDEMWEEQDHVTGTGTSLSLSNTKKGKAKVDLKGNTSQDSTTGKNKYDDSSLYPAVNCSVSNGVVTQTQADTNSNILFKIQRYNGNTYVDQVGQISVTGTGRIELAFTYDSSTMDRVRFGLNGSVRDTLCMTGALNLPNGTYYLSVNFTNITQGSISWKDIMISTTQNDTYEPYTNGASPNPSYPQRVNVVSGDNEVVVCGKNLCSSVTKPVNSMLDFNCNKSLQQIFTISFTLTEALSNNSLSLEIVKNGVKSEYLLDRLTGDANTKTIKTITLTQENYDEIQDGDSVFFRLYKSGANFEIPTDAMIENNNEATSYEPYQSQTYPINLPVENKFNDYRTSGYETNGITISADTNGAKLNGTFNKTSATNLWLSQSDSVNYNNLILLKANTTYTFSARLLSGTISNTNISCIISSRTADESKTFTWNYQTATYSNGTWNKTFTTGGSDIYMSAVRFNLTTNDDEVFTNAVIGIQLEKGTKANSYTPYGTTPIEMCDINDNRDKFIRNSGKNLLNSVEYNKYVSGSGNVTSGNTDYLGINDFVSCKPNTTYTISFEHDNSSGQLYVAYRDVNNSFISRENYSTNRTFTTPNNAYYLFVYIYKSSTFTTIGGYVMLNEGSTALPYEPYGNGDWYKESKIGKYTFDGTETWSSSAYGTNSWASATIFPINYDENKLQVMSNIFRGIPAIERNTAGDNVIYSGSGNYVMIRNTTLTSITEVRSATNGNYIFYALATPTYTKIEGTLKDELEDVYRANSYNGQTNIAQSNNDLPFELDVTALGETE